MADPEENEDNAADFEQRGEFDDELFSSLDFDAVIGPFLEDAGALLDEEGMKLAENIAANLTGSVRQVHNDVESSVSSRQTRTDLFESMNMSLADQNARNIEASFKAHLRALQRQVADQVGIDQRSMTFMGINPNHDPVVLKLSEHAKGNQPTLGDHPHDQTLSVPIPPGYEDIAPQAARLLNRTKAEREADFKKLLRKAANVDDAE